MSFIDGLDPQWIEEQYLLWLEGKSTLSREWHSFFAGFDLAWSKGERHVSISGGISCRGCSLKQSGVQTLIHRYRDIGHLMACTDPLSPCRLTHPLLELALFGLDEADLDTVFDNSGCCGESASLREILQTLHDTYCCSTGVEFMHIQEPGERQWLMDRMEPVRNRTTLEPGERLLVLRRIAEAGLFESFLHRRFPGQKRFSLEGGESVIVFLHQVVELAASRDAEELVLGMAHRGRLNVLANILGKPLANIFSEFSDNLGLAFVGEGDVKYHKGFSAERKLADGRALHMTLAFNPSHLEAVNPVVEGKARARQDRKGAAGHKRVLPLLIHGDAAFSGQGMVAETLNLSQLEGYETGGTIHVVINNQIGFTTLPKDARSTLYSTDVAKMLMVPIFHVNGDDPEAVVHVARLAFDYRRQFGRDVIVEIICYRRHGHNEGDEPSFTQPLMYEQIRERPPLHRQYGDMLIEEGVAGVDLDSLESEIIARLEKALTEEALPAADAGFFADWQGFQRGYEPVTVMTGVAREILAAHAEAMATVPDRFIPHPKVAAVYRRRLEAVRAGTGIDWGNAEALAYATLLGEGVSIRLSGQDSRRGTFNHRHAVLHDITTDATHTPLEVVAGTGAEIRIYDSMLSESAVLGFEYGYSLASPANLVIWEAQFGDFANGAQVVIDQFVAAGESKWDRSSGLVMLLPHGYEGNGAEHSSARIERYLQLCAEDNLLVCYPSTPGQQFHLLRRQVKLPFRKPLMVFTPKSLLRHPSCVSTVDELTTGCFREILAEDVDPAQVSTLLFCSGKIYFELAERRNSLERHDMAIIRIEQLYPLRMDLLAETVAPFTHLTDWRWVQEEPANNGAWGYIGKQLADLAGKELRYVGRPPSAAPAVGSHRLHGVEQQQIIEEAFQEV